MTSYNLYDIVIKNSHSNTFEDAKYEWCIFDFEEEENAECICGKKHIKQCYTIKNKINSKLLYPVGSECIKRFCNPTLVCEMKSISNKYKIFNNVGKKHHGKSYEYICKNDSQYIHFLQHNGNKSKYRKLVEYFNFTNNINIGVH